MTSKVCRKCGIEKSVTEFYPNSGTKPGLRPRCKECYRAEGREYQARPEVNARRREASREREKHRVRSPESIQRGRLWTWHRLRWEQYEALLAAQGGVCAICKRAEPDGRGRFHVDHDHACCPGARSCGKCVRGLLCSRCNPMVGMAKDDPEILRSAVDYLENRNNTFLQAIGAVGDV